MCHDKYHVDPDLRAIANRLSGLPMAQSAEQRARCMIVSQMLLDRCCCEGLAFYLEAGLARVPSGEAHRILTKLAATQERLIISARELLRLNDNEEVPF